MERLYQLGFREILLNSKKFKRFVSSSSYQEFLSNKIFEINLTTPSGCSPADRVEKLLNFTEKDSRAYLLTKIRLCHDPRAIAVFLEATSPSAFTLVNAAQHPGVYNTFLDPLESQRHAEYWALREVEGFKNFLLWGDTCGSAEFQAVLFSKEFRDLINSKRFRAIFCSDEFKKEMAIYGPGNLFLSDPAVRFWFLNTISLLSVTTAFTITRGGPPNQGVRQEEVKRIASGAEDK